MSVQERLSALTRLVEAEGVTRLSPPLLLPAVPYFDLAGEEFGRRLLLTQTVDGNEYCLRPDFTLPIVRQYLDKQQVGRPAAFSYLGPVFRQRSDGYAEFDQAGLELLAQPDPDLALDRVFAFARSALEIYGVTRPAMRLGGVGLFEALLAAADMPDAWRSRIRQRFGHTEALERLLARLESAQGAPEADIPAYDQLVADITERMVAAGLSLSEGRSPEEIASRYLEQQALDAARVPRHTLALLRDYLAISGEALHALTLIEKLARENRIDLSQALGSLRRHIVSLGPDLEIFFEAQFSPRLDYYTGIVFEMTGQGGEVLASGGQYDRLLERLGASAPIPSSGCAVWVDRLNAEASR